MDTVTQLKMSRLPKFLGSLTYSNQLLKMFSITSLVLCLLLTIALSLCVTRPPVILAFDSGGNSLARGVFPKPEDQIREAIKAYLDKRYNWTPTSVQSQLASAKAFILPSSTKSYEGAIAPIARFSMEKQVSQKTYPDKFEIDLEKKTVEASGDRISVIQSMRAAGLLHLELHFECGPRTVENPWGIYITQEKDSNEAIHH